MQRKYARERSIRITPIFWSAVIVISIWGSSALAENVKNGISLCLGTVIPAVFPFMIISSLITVSGSSSDIGRFFEKPLRAIFGANANEACAISLGLLCGYPVGALSASEMFDRGEISKDEFEHLLTFINVPSAPFVISGVGMSMLSSKKMGLAIYTSIILSAMIVGFILRPWNKSKIKISKFNFPRPRLPFSQVIIESISKAAKNMLLICACVISFSALSGVLCSVLPISDISKAILSGFFEVSSGAKNASIAAHAPLLCASICAWSGLSVHFQIISACRGRGISFIPFFISKAVQAAIAPFILFIYISFCP